MHHTQPVTYFTSTFVPADDDRVPDLETDRRALCFESLTEAQKRWIPIRGMSAKARGCRPQGGMAWNGRSKHPQSMQVPPDLASRVSTLAARSGRSPEAFLREAISHLIESAAPVCAALEDAQQTGFVPQPQSFSVYE
jgi:predicted transcriptional regulator